MPSKADTRLSDAALLAFPVSILAAAVLTILVAGLLPGGLILRNRYACPEPVLLNADMSPAAIESADTRLMCAAPDGSYTPYAPGRAVFVSWLAYTGGLFLVFFGLFSRKPRRRRKKRTNA